MNFAWGNKRGGFPVSLVRRLCLYYLLYLPFVYSIYGRPRVLLKILKDAFLHLSFILINRRVQELIQGH